MTRYCLALIMIVFLVMPIMLHAQEDEDGYTIALARIQEVLDANTTSLDLTALNLTDVPPEIFQLSNLEWLSLSGNQLTSLPSEIFQLSTLRVLFLSDNQLMILPEEIFQLSNLETLDLSDNQLTSLPEEIFQLSNLETLDLSDNQLTSLPEGVFQLSNLEWLSLSDNQLTSLPEGIFQLSNLRFLYLNNNHLTSLALKLGGLPLADLYALDNLLIFPPQYIVDQGRDATLDFLRHPRPYPPYRMSGSVMGVVVVWIVAMVVSVVGLLRVLNRR